MRYPHLHVRRAGFTLVEILVVIGIIVVLAALLFPLFWRARAKAQMTTCLSQVHQLSTLLAAYAHDHDGVMPGETTWNDGIDPALLRCPAQGDGLGYVYNSRLAGRRVSGVYLPSQMLVVADGVVGRGVATTNADLAFPHLDKHGIAAFLDGHSAAGLTSDEDIYYLGDLLASKEELQAKLGIALTVVPGKPLEQLAYIETVPTVLRELSLYPSGMLSPDPQHPTPGTSFIKRIFLLPRYNAETRKAIPTDAKPVQSLLDYPLQSDCWWGYWEGADSGVSLVLPRYLYPEDFYRFNAMKTVSEYGRSRGEGVYRVMLDTLLFSGMRKWGKLDLHVSEWTACNPSGYVYPSNGKNDDDPRFDILGNGWWLGDESHIAWTSWGWDYLWCWNCVNFNGMDHPFGTKPAFICDWADTKWQAWNYGFNLRADQTSFYALMFCDFAGVKARAEYDPAIAKKMTVMEGIITSYVPGMTQGYWNFICDVNKRNPLHYTGLGDSTHAYIRPDPESRALLPGEGEAP